MNVGHSHIILGNNEKAIFYYEKAISIEPSYFASQFNLGRLYEDKGYTQKALLHYRRAEQIDPYVSEVHGKLGEIYIQTGEYESANIHLRRAVERNPKYAEAFRNLGVLNYYYLNKKKQAITFFKRSLNLNPNQSEKELILRLLTENGVTR